MTYFTIVLEQIFIFIIYAMIGVVCVKTGIINKDGLNVFSRLITKVTLPVMIFTNTINGATRRQFLDSLSVLLLSAVMYFLLYLLGRFLAGRFALSGNEKNAFHACTMFGNVGFMGIPLVSALFPEQGMLYIALFTVIDQLVLWTEGVHLATPVSQEKRLSFADSMKKMINPPTVGIVLAVIFIFLNLRLPELLNTALVRTGAITTPLAMIYLGGLFCYTDIGYYLRRPEFYCSVLIKMTAFPILFCMVLRLFPGIQNDIAVTMSVLSAMPTMSSIAMIIQQQKSAGEYAAGMIFTTTLCSIVTIPLVCLLICP